MEEWLLIEDHELGIDFRMFLEWNEKYPKQSSQPILQKIDTIGNPKKGGDKKHSNTNPYTTHKHKLQQVVVCMLIPKLDKTPWEGWLNIFPEETSCIISPDLLNMVDMWHCHDMNYMVVLQDFKLVFFRCACISRRSVISTRKLCLKEQHPNTRGAFPRICEWCPSHSTWCERRSSSKGEEYDCSDMTFTSKTKWTVAFNTFWSSMRATVPIRLFTKQKRKPNKINSIK